MKQQLKLKKKKKKKVIVIGDQKTESAQKVALISLQKQLQLLKLKEYLLLIGFTLGGALLRIPMQEVPSAEPITFFALLAGWLFGRKKGFMVGATSGYISNFFMFGGQGPWTPFQMLGWGIAGFLGGFLGKKASIWKVIPITIAATLAFEIIMNSVTPLMTGGNLIIIFMMAIPFITVHLVSNLIFCLFLPKTKKLIYEKGGFNEKAMCVDLINKFKQRVKWLPKPGRSERKRGFFSNIINWKHDRREV